ncbi:hypothetical protein ACO2KH_18035 [Leptospira terpstrae]|uniref:hypothetical protein n=1 Tax=Leptospira terpstrae TaxID=293075 RepID=UPI003D08D2A2
MNLSKEIRYIFLVFCALSFYSYGTAMMDYFLVYPSRFLIGEKEFIVYHKLLEAAIWPISVIPFLVIISLNAFLLTKALSKELRKLLLVSLSLLILDFLSTILLQAPWNEQLSAGKNIVLMQKISDTNWGRVFLETAQVGVVFKLLVNFNSSQKQ